MRKTETITLKEDGLLEYERMKILEWTDDIPDNLGIIARWAVNRWAERRLRSIRMERM
jgi:hypothetical protein